MSTNGTRVDVDADGAARATPSMTRRLALVRVAALPLVAALPAALSACSREPKCVDAPGLTPEEAKVRTEIAAYVEPSPDPAKRCDACVQYVAGPDKGCGSCKVVKGPIHPGGTCKLFVAKPA